MEVREEGNYILITNCHHQNDSCIKMDSDESHFNVSLVVRDKAQDSVHRHHNFDHNHSDHNFEERGEPKRNRTEILLLTSLTPYR